MINLGNAIDMLMHIIKTLHDYKRPHTIYHIYIDDEKHYYCDCGYKKPQRIRVKIKD